MTDESKPRFTENSWLGSWGDTPLLTDSTATHLNTIDAALNEPGGPTPKVWAAIGAVLEAVDGGQLECSKKLREARSALLQEGKKVKDLAESQEKEIARLIDEAEKMKAAANELKGLLRNHASETDMAEVYSMPLALLFHHLLRIAPDSPPAEDAAAAEEVA